MVETIQNAMDSEQVSAVTTVFPGLGEAIARVAQDLIKEQIKIAKEKIKDHVDMMATFVKTFDFDFQISQVKLLINKMIVTQPLVNGSIQVADSAPGCNPKVWSRFEYPKAKGASVFGYYKQYNMRFIYSIRFISYTVRLKLNK